MLTDYTDLAVVQVRMVTHPSTNWAHGYLASVINHVMLTPSYQGSNFGIRPKQLMEAKYHDYPENN